MEIQDLSHSFLSLLAPMIAVILAIVTRRVVLSLGIAILVGAIVLTDFNVLASAIYLFNKVLALFWDEGAINSWNTNILLFLVILGVITSLLTYSGATSAFALWAEKRVKSSKRAKVLTVLLGLFIFIDDYFNSLAVGSICRPITDKYQVSRAKLAYLLDSTAAPMCVLMPISSWGAYIITVIGGIMVAQNYTEMSPLMAFIAMIPMNFYAVFALVVVFLTAYLGLTFGPMKKAEELAQQGQLFDSKLGTPPGYLEDIPDAQNESLWGLLVPICGLIVGTMVSFIWLGAQNTEGEFTVLKAFENTDVALALVYGGVFGLFITLMSVVSLKAQSIITKSFKAGAMSMLPALIILTFAWTIAAIIADSKTGIYLSSMVGDSLPAKFLPILLFILSGIMAFATGTSWGTFGIMLPIAGDMAFASDVAFLLPMMASVLAGAVFGDHCSPISDTTILSSTGANCHHITHITTQLPYALMTAVFTIISYLALAFTSSVSIALVVGLLCLFAWTKIQILQKK